MNKKVYRVEVQVAPMEGTQLPTDWLGAFVNVFIGSENILNAIKAVESQLLKDCYRLVNTRSAFELDLDETDYDTDEEGVPDNKGLIHIQNTGGIWYGPFYTYDTETELIQ